MEHCLRHAFPYKVDQESGGIIFGNPQQDIQAAFDVAAFQGNMAQ
jgi:hypothetical protein